MVVPSGPIYHDIPLTSDQQIRGIDAPTCSQSTEVVKSLEPRAVDSLIDLEYRVEFAIIPHLQLLLLCRSILLNDLLSLRRHPRLQILDIVRIVKGPNFLRGGLSTVKHP